jgi:hypothetical protein
VVDFDFFHPGVLTMNLNRILRTSYRKEDTDDYFTYDGVSSQYGFVWSAGCSRNTPYQAF